MEEKKEQGKPAPEQKKEAAPVTKAAEEKKEPQATTTVEEKPKIKLSKKMEDVVKTVETMSVLELADLVHALEDKFGVSAQAPVAMAGVAVAGAGGAGGQEEEKTTFNIVLTGAGDKKIQVIKEIRAVTTLGLKEAKDLVEAAPKTVKEAVPKEEAEKIKKQLEAVGAKVELK